MKHRPLYFEYLLLSGLFFTIPSTFSQTSADPELLAAIQKIKAIDNHSHVLPARKPEPAESERPDPLGRTPFGYPVRLRVTNPEYIDAWRALYGYKHHDMAAEHVREALKAKLRLMVEKGTDYPSWILDQAGIDIILVNMPSLGPGQNAPRFLWVPKADGFLFPFGGEKKEVKWVRKEVGLDSVPASLQEYENNIRQQLEQWRQAGAVAIKFTIAYFRPLDFAPASEDEANHVFEGHRTDGKPSAQEYRILQDFLFHFMAQEAGRLRLAVHIHTGIGADPYFNISGSNPLLLETMFNDPALWQTNFVMVHGGWPFEREAGVMLIKPNVYADFSDQAFLRSTEALSEVLRAWLEWYPEKILFGTDAYPEDTPLANWEEKLWLATRTARQALAIALTQMLQAGQITRPRAEELARMVLRENAFRLYGLALNER